jgi:hypothetical protein
MVFMFLPLGEATHDLLRFFDSLMSSLLLGPSSAPEEELASLKRNWLHCA